MTVQEDHWLATVLGYPVLRLDVDLEPSAALPVLRPPPGAGRALYYAKVPTDRPDVVGRLSVVGFHVIDVAVAFMWTSWKAPAALPASRRWVIRDIESADHEAVLGIASSCFRYSRFHLDPAIGIRAANRVKREWIRSYIRKERGDRLYVALDGDAPAGFLAVVAADGEQPRRLIDLIGVHPGYHRQGVGEALVRFFLEVHGDPAHRLEVGTQVANIPSMRLYEKLGFSVAGSRYVLHLHVGVQQDGVA